MYRKHAMVTAQFWYWHNALGQFQYSKDLCIALFFCSLFKISSESMPRTFYEWTPLISGKITGSHVNGCICVISIHDHCSYKFVNMTIERRSLVRQHTWWPQDAKHGIDLLLIQAFCWRCFLARPKSLKTFMRLASCVGQSRRQHRDAGKLEPSERVFD